MPEIEPSFKSWVLSMREDQSLIDSRVKDDTLRRFVLNAPLDDRKNGNTRRLLQAFLEQDERWSALQKTLNVAREREEALMLSLPHVMIMRDNKPRETRILLRGNYETPGDAVKPKLPEFLLSGPSTNLEEPQNRLTLATWLVSDQNH